MTGIISQIVFMIGLAIMAVFLVVETFASYHYNGEYLIQRDFSLTWGLAEIKNPMAHPVVWTLHICFGTLLATDLGEKSPSSDMVFVLWMLTAIALACYVLTFVFRVLMAHKGLVYGRQLAENAQIVLDRATQVNK